MKNSTKTAKIVRIIARIWGSIILIFILMFFLGYAFGDEGLGLDNVSNQDKITFLFFPIGTIIGLIIAYKSEKVGGIIATLGMIVLLILQPELITNPFIMIGILPSGILYLVYGFLFKKHD